MRKERGFTLIELMVVIAILGILVVSAFPTYRTFRRRAVGAEATTIMKQLINAEIMYYLANNSYYPDQTVTGTNDAQGQIMLSHNDLPTDLDIQRVRDALKVTLPVRHFLDFQIIGIPDPDPTKTTSIGVNILIDANFPIFKDGTKGVHATIDSQGNIVYF
ncbi:MAG: hypothetical protein DRG71_05695 [Deltaproteobacteria bacterium]|nr:MAG: hypothetical protein DRG71_05695 [Deltaproteobacteria bacterium]HDG98550.1 type II secretion system protein [Desulfobacterales bacterium]